MHMSKPEITIKQSRARKSELGSALINLTTSFSAEALMSNAAGERWFLPVYRSAAQAAGGTQVFTPSAAEDGTLTFYLESVAPPPIAGQAGSAHAVLMGTSFCLVLNASGAGSRIPLNAAGEGGNIWRLRTKLGGNELKMARAALFDANPNVAIEVTQTATIAVPLTQAFVESNWPDAIIRKGLLDTFAGIPFDSASTFYMMAQQADADYANQYMVLNCIYRAQVPAPPLPGYIRWQINWANRAYNYYQDNQERNRVFYLPDKFELAKGPAGAPAVSLLQFTLPAGPVSVERTQATFRVYGRPVVDFDRIQNAKVALQPKIGGSPQMVSLQDAHHANTKFTQYLPNMQATSSDPAVQTDASIDLSAGLRNELKLNFKQFRALWAAIFSAALENPLFRGWVDIELSDGKYKDRIDFNGRLPVEQETPFFDDILDTSLDSTYPAQFTVHTFKNVFEGDPKVLEIEVAFPGAETLTLTAESMKAQVKVERSIRDIVLGKQSPDEYPYKLRVVQEDGVMRCCTGTARSDTPNLRLNPEQIKKCTGDCGP